MMGLFDNPELDSRDAVLKQHEQNYASILDYLRGCLKLIYVRNREIDGESFVTADDARRIFENAIRSGRFVRPHSMNFMGQLFKTKDWRFTGQRVKSQTPGSHANELKCWVYIGK